MMDLLGTFAALSLAGTAVLSLLPEGGLKRTASMAVGLLMLLCWAEGIASLLGLSIPDISEGQALAPTSVSVENAAREASAALHEIWEVEP